MRTLGFNWKFAHQQQQNIFFGRFNAGRQISLRISTDDIPGTISAIEDCSSPGPPYSSFQMNTPNVNLSFVEDSPASLPQFDFDLIAEALAALMLQSCEGATVLGIHGPWGAGKTTLMQAVGRAVRTQLGVAGVHVEFNAWKFQDRQALWRALILRVLGELRKCGGDPAQLDELEQSLYRAFTVEEKGPWRINWRVAVVELVGLGLATLQLDFVGRAVLGNRRWLQALFSGKAKEVDGESPVIDKDRVERLAGVLERTAAERQVLQVQSIEQFVAQYRKLIDDMVRAGRRVFVYIDDLDRCLPDTAIEVFEAIKLFLDAPGSAYVVALDRDIIRKGLAIRYAAAQAAPGQTFIDPDEYIEKTISVSFDLPRLAHAEAFTLIRAFSLPITLRSEHMELIVDGLGTNPRRIKRFMNTLALQLHLARLAHEGGRPVPPPLLDTEPGQDFALFLKLLMLAYRYSALTASAIEDPALLQRLQRASNLHANTLKEQGPVEAREKRRDALTTEASSVLFLQNDEEFWHLLDCSPSFNVNSGILRQLIQWFYNHAAER